MEQDERPSFPSTDPNRRRNQLIGILITSGLLLVCALCGVAFAAIRRDRSNTVVDEPSASPTLVPSDDPLRSETPGATASSEDIVAHGMVGDPLRAGALELTVTGDRCGVRALSLATPARGQFCLVTITVRNLGQTTQAVTVADSDVISATGRRYPASAVASRYAGALPASLPPAASRTGVVAFDLPRTEVIDRVELHPSALGGGVAVQFVR
jgi:hypothetical protein